MNQSQEDDNKENKSKSWKHVIDKVLDFISSSKSTLRILNEKHSITDERKAEAAKQNAKELIRRKLLKDNTGFIEFLKNDTNDDTLNELHVNESFNEKTESNVRCSIIYDEEQSEKREECASRQRHTSMNFLDEQYNLTKQAIARRYRPQMKINSISKNAMRDFLNEPFNEELHRISNVASERISINRVKKKHTKQIEKNPPCNNSAIPALETHVIYENYEMHV